MILLSNICVITLDIAVSKQTVYSALHAASEPSLPITESVSAIKGKWWNWISCWVYLQGLTANSVEFISESFMSVKLRESCIGPHIALRKYNLFKDFPIIRQSKAWLLEKPVYLAVWVLLFNTTWVSIWDKTWMGRTIGILGANSIPLKRSILQHTIGA